MPGLLPLHAARRILGGWMTHDHNLHESAVQLAVRLLPQVLPQDVAEDWLLLLSVPSSVH